MCSAKSFFWLQILISCWLSIQHRFEKKIIKCVFSMFKDNLLVANQITTLFNSHFIHFTNSSIFLPFKNILVSSANRIGKRMSDTLQISLMYNKNKRGPRIEPCGTPQVTCLSSDLVLWLQIVFDPRDNLWSNLVLYHEFHINIICLIKLYD